MRILNLAITADGNRVFIVADVGGEDVLAERFTEDPEGEFREIPITIIRAKTDSKPAGISEK